MIFLFIIHYFCQHLVSWLDRSVPINNSIQPKISNLQHQIMNRELWRMWQEEWWVEKQARCDGLDLKDLSKAHMQKASSQSVVLGEGGNFGRWGLVQAGLTTGNVSLKGTLTCWSFSVLLFFQDEVNLSHTLPTMKSAFPKTQWKWDHLTLGWTLYNEKPSKVLLLAFLTVIRN